MVKRKCPLCTLEGGWDGAAPDYKLQSSDLMRYLSAKVIIGYFRGKLKALWVHRKKLLHRNCLHADDYTVTVTHDDSVCKPIRDYCICHCVSHGVNVIQAIMLPSLSAKRDILQLVDFMFRHVMQLLFLSSHLYVNLYLAAMTSILGTHRCERIVQ